MKILNIVFILLFLTSLSVLAQANRIVGQWKISDSESDTARMVVNIYKATNKKYYGNIEKVGGVSDTLCVDCNGSNKNKPLEGMTVISGMKINGNGLSGGSFLDVTSGKTYYCTISLDTRLDRLHVRSSIDKKGWVGRTQIWEREK